MDQYIVTRYISTLLIKISKISKLSSSWEYFNKLPETPLMLHNKKNTNSVSTEERSSFQIQA